LSFIKKKSLLSQIVVKSHQI